MLEPWLNSKGISDAEQVLAYFAVSKLGETPVDGKTDTNPEGLTAAYGKWAPVVAARLHAAALSCKVTPNPTIPFSVSPINLFFNVLTSHTHTHTHTRSNTVLQLNSETSLH